MNYKSRLSEAEIYRIIEIFEENDYRVVYLSKLLEALNVGATYIGTKDDIIDQWCDLMEANNIPREFLDEDTIIFRDDDWVHLEGGRHYLNTFRVFEDLEYEEWEKLGYIKKI